MQIIFKNEKIELSVIGDKVFIAVFNDSNYEEQEFTPDEITNFANEIFRAADQAQRNQLNTKDA